MEAHTVRRVLPASVELIPKGALVLLTLGGYTDVTGRHVRSIWNRGHGLIGLDRGNPATSWYGLPTHQVWISNQDAALLELWAQYGIRGYVHPRGIVIRESDAGRVSTARPRTLPNRNRVRMFAEVNVIVSPDWTFDPMSVANARLGALWRICFAPFYNWVDGIVAGFTRKDRL